MFWGIMSIAEGWTMPEQQVQKPDQVSEVTTSTMQAWNMKYFELWTEMYPYSVWHVQLYKQLKLLIRNIYSLIILNPGWRIKTCSLYPTEAQFFPLSHRNPVFLGLRPWNHKSEVVDKHTAS